MSKGMAFFPHPFFIFIVFLRTIPNDEYTSVFNLAGNKYPSVDFNLFFINMFLCRTLKAQQY